MRWGTFSLVVGLALGSGGARATETPEELLRRSDISTFAPSSFSAHVTLKGTRSESLHFEVWRAGETRTLVRFLDAKDRGKYLLKRDDVLWFLAPRAKKPVRLHPSYKLAGGASLDEILGLRYSREYKVAGVAEAEDGLVALDLEAAGSDVRHPRVRYFVRRNTQRPVRIEFQSSSGKATGRVEFLEWEEGPRPRPRRLLVTDLLRPETPEAVEITEVNERTVPDELFDLHHATARSRLEANSPP
jgi:hypothetical protein